MTYIDLTNRQQTILQYIKSELKRKGYPPSVREIAAAVGLNSTSTVHSHLSNLEKKGYIRRDATKPRAIEVLDGSSNTAPKKETVDVPILGSITAGQPILAFENVEDTFPIPAEIAKADQVFMLSIKGDSMVEAGILDGDYVLVRQQSTANNGDIVAALIDEEATVKTFYKETDCFRLQPENSQLEPIMAKELSILGKVIGVYRHLA
ncbi:repressor LexA [Desulfitispora alkaliphila]|uniref:transcriptional repressor LexA n=1 Tax=Desulfitispora alkaliphila TaxID=622674 RepID=UPI003D262B87